MKDSEFEFFRKDGEKVEHPDIIMWVGASYYPTPKDFIDEARKMGISKRVVGVPSMLEVGSTRLFLVHPAALPDPSYIADPNMRSVDYNEKTKPEMPGVFALTVIEKVELIVGNDPESLEKFRKLEAEGVRPVYQQDVEMEAERGCGHRQIGGLYLVTDEDFNRIIESGVVGAIDIKGGIGDIVPPIACKGLYQHKGIQYIDGDAIMNGEPWEMWVLARRYKPKPKKVKSETTPGAPPPPQTTPEPAMAPAPPEYAIAPAQEAPPAFTPPVSEPTLDVPPDGGW